MFISVIIPTYKRHNDLPRLLASLHTQIIPPKEILVVIGPGDNESFMIAESWKEKIPNIKIIAAKKPSTVHALNLGLVECKEEIICMLDDDVWLPPDWSTKISEAYLEKKDMGAYGGRDHLQIEQHPELMNPTLADKVGVFTWDGSLTGNHHCGVKKSPVDVDVLKGCNLSLRRAAFKRMQIDIALESRGAEICWEIDICQQIQRAGFKLIYDNNNYVLHFASPRLAYDNRNDIFADAWSERVFNESYVRAKYRSVYEVFLFGLRSFFIGSRNVPGIAWSVLLIPKYGLKILKLPWVYSLNIFRGVLQGYNLRKEKLIDVHVI